MYRAVLIGCGKIGSSFADDPLIQGVYTHAGAYDACDKTQLVGVCDRSPEVAKQCADRWGVSHVYTDILAALEEQRPDLVSVCVPNEFHAQVLEQVLRAPGVLGVLMEKPLALDVADARKLVELAASNGVALAVNYSRRYSVTHLQVRERIAQGELGEIQSVGGFYTKGLFHNGTHWIDLARWLVGDVSQVQGFDRRRWEAGDGQVSVRLHFENGAQAYLQPLNADAYSLFEMDIVGTKGRIRLTDSGHRVKTSKVVPSPYYSGYQTLVEHSEQAGDLSNTLLYAVQDLVTAVEKKQAPQCSGGDGLRALQIASAAFSSALSGRPISGHELHGT